MIELPEALTLARQLNESVAGKRVARVLPPTKPHKFCWFSGDAAEYDGRLRGASAVEAEGFGIFAQLRFDNGLRLSLNDGVAMRLVRAEDAPRDRQLLIEFADGDALVFTVQMYGGIMLHTGELESDFYRKSRAYVSPFSDAFNKAYADALSDFKLTKSAKAFIATEQRFPGLGNGTAQDILFSASIHPKRKLSTLTKSELERLRVSICDTLRDMTERGGRDTERDLYGARGGYATKMSAAALKTGCPVCGGPVTKEAYLGGSVYYCPHCQPLP